MPSRESRPDADDDRDFPSPPLTDRLIGEAHQLHAEVEALTSATNLWSSPSARRRLRNAKQAETDLLRVLGFVSYGDFLTLVARTAPPPAPGTVAISTPDDPRGREIERALGAALAEIEELRTKLAQYQGNVVDPKAAPPATSTAPPPPTTPPPLPPPEPPAAEELVRSFGAELGRAADDLEELRSTVREIHGMAIETAAELIAAKLEIIVALRRAGLEADVPR
jgi:hypothetical protein